MNIEDFVKQYQILRNIKRFSMESVIVPQNLCEHGYGVGNLFYFICKERGIKIDAELLFRIYNHDFVESFSGDLNKSVKEFDEQTLSSWKEIENKIVPNHLKEFSEKNLEDFVKTSFGERVWTCFLLADAIDAACYCEAEISLGNRNLVRALTHYVTHIKSLYEILNK